MSAQSFADVVQEGFGCGFGIVGLRDRPSDDDMIGSRSDGVVLGVMTRS